MNEERTNFYLFEKYKRELNCTKMEAMKSNLKKIHLAVRKVAQAARAPKEAKNEMASIVGKSIKEIT